MKSRANPPAAYEIMARNQVRGSINSLLPRELIRLKAPLECIPPSNVKCLGASGGKIQMLMKQSICARADAHAFLPIRYRWSHIHTRVSLLEPQGLARLESVMNNQNAGAAFRTLQQPHPHNPMQIYFLCTNNSTKLFRHHVRIR
jgi:hypothetical protein